MTSLRSSLSPKNSALTVLARLAAFGLALLLFVTSAEAGRRKRIVVLEFDGPKAVTLHTNVVKLIKARHTVVSLKVWNRTAERLDATKATERNLRKIARRLKVDGIVIGEVEKRKGQYFIRLKLKAGTTGELVGRRLDIKSRSPKLDARARREIKEELIAAIDELDRNRGERDVAEAEADADADERDDDAKPKRRRADEDESNDEDEPTAKTRRRSKSDDEPDAESEEEPAVSAKKRKSKVSTDTDDDDESTSRKKSNRSAADNNDGDRDDDRDDGDAVGTSGKSRKKAIEAPTPAHRAIEVVVGATLNVRQLRFTADADLVNSPPSYRQSLPVSGAVIDAVVYPFALGGNRTGLLAGVGLELMYDRVLFIQSQRKYVDNMMQLQTADLSTTQDRWAAGAVVRYPVSQRVVLGAKAQYSVLRFDIAQQLPNGASADIPSVRYAMIEPKLFVHFSLIPSLSLRAEGGMMLVSSSGGIENAMTGYGSTSTSGFEVSAGVDYQITSSIFVRVVGRLERLSLTFAGDPNSLSNTRDADAMQDVQGATDLYYGGLAAFGYAY